MIEITIPGLILFGLFIAWLWYEQQPDVAEKRKEERMRRDFDETD